MKNQSSKAQFQTLPSEGFVRLPQVLQVMGVCKSTWWNGVRSGKFPQPVKLGPRTTAWRVADIRQLIENLSNQTTEVA